MFYHYLKYEFAQKCFSSFSMYSLLAISNANQFFITNLEIRVILSLFKGKN